MSPLLELSGLEAGYGGASVLHDVSLTVRPGESWAVLGPNGAGKSTLVRVLMGMLVPTRGTAHFEGRPLADWPARALAQRLAWVPQVTDDATEFTALELALMGRAPHLPTWGVPGVEDEARAKAVLAELGVEALAHRPLAQVSGGERRRVWLARALIQQPKLLVLDEPTAFLDVRHQVEALQVVQRRVCGGLGVVAVLHDVNLARYVATHAVLLKNGRVVKAGLCDEVLTAELLSQVFEIEMVQGRDHWAPSPLGRGAAPR